MTGAAAGCAGPACSRPVARPGTGRPARYCSPGAAQRLRGPRYLRDWQLQGARSANDNRKRLTTG
jgi:hypothetical protein